MLAAAAAVLVEVQRSALQNYRSHILHTKANGTIQKKQVAAKLHI
jgi:hypothetical protein